MTEILGKKQIAECIDRIADMIIEDAGQDCVILGIRSRGEEFGRRIANAISAKTGSEVASGTLDITLYRDDIVEPGVGSMRPVKPSVIPCPLTDRSIVLADDVLHTGRSCRAALDAIVAYGRPKMIKLAVLVDRDGREYPIQADYSGVSVDITDDETVKVRFEESDGVENVIIEQVDKR